MASASVVNAWAQTLTPEEAANQESLRQQERERLLRQRQEQIPDVRFERLEPQSEAARIPDESPCFFIRKISLSGDSADRFTWALDFANRRDDGQIDKATGRCLGANGINLIMKRIQNALIARGYITTRVLAERQDLRDGTLALTLIPGRIRGIHFADPSDIPATAWESTHGADGRRRAILIGRRTLRFPERHPPHAALWNALPVHPGKILDLRDLEQGIENFKRVPTVDADIQIAPAEVSSSSAPAPGESDLIVAWRQSSTYRLHVSADDSGAKATGKYQGSMTLSVDNGLNLSDLFYVSLGSDLGSGEGGDYGNRNYTAHYSAPFGYWLLGLTASRYGYHQSVAGASQVYLYKGTSNNAEVSVSRVFHRDATSRTIGTVSGWLRESRNFIDDTEVEVQRRRMGGWKAGVTHRATLGSSVLEAALAWRQGTGAFNSLPAPEEQFGEGTSRPKILTFDAQLELPLAFAGKQWAYVAATRVQRNHTRLIPQDYFGIGGRYTVRGFDGERLLAAERGYWFRNTLLWVTGNALVQPYIGVDWGKVGGPTSDELVGTSLVGGVIGLRGGGKRWRYDVFVGRPLSRPTGFETDTPAFGFNISSSF